MLNGATNMNAAKAASPGADAAAIPTMAARIEAWKNKPLTTGQKRRITRRRNAARAGK